ncbi:MAG: DNA gyrase inhibitor YacG [Candidatus Thiodiazotropha lotti]|uniref:DNA gyrase inhibitor YacG n=1 Tax=Candidatus Thiodiazotropha lotti TaxID=2792787 RepID=A0A9E4K8K8_9GAMM|nr:DNA gyrase inhibitor YacG [Candidatus Thiodiazotropha lotti]ODC00429.1 DNA gyrase inhibitor [Candidatus Thiodiazotropha endoloripes]MCG7922842.1 DNA gyrase inhibitor YacG [Candidatus Thiodiazotropha lotti]MCG7941184.1 DNA gyrase inhibitor YacG [Candidatus Thiodiazotropha lotti]MCG7985135.1 DNA gyrase inhibitor YacG [Candidatus Thiodiazotropha lotti]
MENTTPTTVPCPNCGKSVLWEERSKWKPFCSERCRLIDLGDWLDENHRISEPHNDQLEDEPFD